MDASGKLMCITLKKICVIYIHTPCGKILGHAGPFSLDMEGSLGEGETTGQ